MDYAARNREIWDRKADDYQKTHSEQLAASGGAAWGGMRSAFRHLGLDAR